MSIFKWATEPKKIYMWVDMQIPTESIVIKIKADASWNLKIPVAWRSTSTTQDCAYNWKISVDSWAETTKSWTWSTTPITIATGLAANSEHMVTIKPTTEWYWWARAFGFFNSWIANLLTEIIYDWSYMWYAVSATNTGDEFRSQQYNSCSLITAAPEEVIPDTVTTYWDYFRWMQYAYCTSLTEIKWWKDLSVSANRYYRYAQYTWCTANKTIKVLTPPIAQTWYDSYKKTLDNAYVTSVSVPSAYLNDFKNFNYRPRSDITDSKFVWY